MQWRLTTGLTVGKWNRASMKEATVFFRAFPDREAHTRFFPVDGAEPGGIETLGGRIGSGLGLGLGLAFGLGRGVALTGGIRRVGSRAGTIGTVSPFTVALAATRGARRGLRRTRSSLEQVRHLATAESNLMKRIGKAPAMVSDELRHRGPNRPICQDNLLERRAPQGCVHWRCKGQMQKSIVELLDGGQMDKVQHGQSSSKQAQGAAQYRARWPLHVEVD